MMMMTRATEMSNGNTLGDYLSWLDTTYHEDGTASVRDEYMTWRADAAELRRALASEAPSWMDFDEDADGRPVTAYAYDELCAVVTPLDDDDEAITALSAPTRPGLRPCRPSRP